MIRSACYLFLFALFLALVGCGGSSGSSGTLKGLTINPANVNVSVGQQAVFTAVLDGAKPSVVWSVDGGIGNGTITTDGTYTAPNAPGTYTVRATVAGGTTTATSRVVVAPPVTIAISSPLVTPVIIPRSQVTFGATVTGGTNQGVTWSVNGSQALIDTNGVFTAPDTLGTYTVEARSVSDPTKSATRVISVVANANVRFTFANKGDVVFGLRPDKAPNTCANLVTLVNKSFYNGILVHRVDSLVAQWGDPLTKTLPLTDPSIGTGGPGYTINFETNDLKNVAYSLGMARASGLNTAGSQIYVPFTAQTSFDGNYVVFGSVVLGRSVIDSLAIGDKILSATTEPATG